MILARHAGAGADYIFTTAPYYHPHGAEGRIATSYVGDATDLPLMVRRRRGDRDSLPLLKRIPKHSHAALREAVPALSGQDRAVCGRDGR